MLDVDGVLISGRPQDGKPLFTDLETDLGLPLPLLKAAFFERHWTAIVTGREPMLPRLTDVLADIAPQIEAQTLIDYWFSNDSRLTPGMLDDIGELRAAGLRVMLATNQEHLRAHWLMETLGLGAHLDGIVYSAALGARKPEPAFFERAAVQVGEAAEQLVLVDDTLPNVEGARLAGWQAKHWMAGMSLLDTLAPFR